MKVCFIRHGETDWNLAQKIQGWHDEPLNYKGYRQALSLGTVLVHHTFDIIYCSDLLRARQTAEPIAHLLKLDIRESQHLRERHFGDFQGMTWEEIRKQTSEEQAREHPPNGEPRVQVLKRVLDFMDTLLEQHPTQTVLVVSHGGILDLVYRIAKQISLSEPRAWEIPNAGLNWLEYDGGCWKILSWAECDHLDQPEDDFM